MREANEREKTPCFYMTYFIGQLMTQHQRMYLVIALIGS